MHLLAAAYWVGGAAVVAWAVITSWSSEADRQRAGLLRWIRAFSPGAALSFAVLTITGVLQTELQVGSVYALFNTAYGWVLSVKLALVTLLVIVAARHVITLRPRVTANLGSKRGGDPLRTGPVRRWLALMRVEAVIGVAIAVLVGGLTTLTPAVEDVPERLQIPAFGRQPVVVAESVGDLKAIITLFPGRLGANRVDVRLVTPKGMAAEAVQRVQVWATPEDAVTKPDEMTDEIETESVAPVFAERRDVGRFTAQVTFPSAGRWRLHVQAQRPGEEPVEGGLFLTAPIPDTRLVVTRAERAMNQLDSAVMEETLTSDGVHIVSTRYEFVAPDRMHYQIKGGAEMIGLGEIRFIRRPGQGWEKSAWPGLEPFRWPRFDWAENAREITLLGTDNIRGESTWVVAFLDPSFDARYRLWVGVDDGRAHRLRMIATAHYMQWDFSRFNEPLKIEAPPSFD